jgi:hypothetical protein
MPISFAKMETGLPHIIVLSTIQDPRWLSNIYMGIAWTDFLGNGRGEPLSLD